MTDKVTDTSTIITISDFIINGKLHVHVVPGAANTAVHKAVNGVVFIRLAASPEKGKANKELLKFLKKEFGLKCRIVSGEKSREKVLEVEVR